MGFVERMKWWQWIALSLVLGALLGYLNSGGANAPVEHSSMSPMIFETGLMGQPYANPAHPDQRRPQISGIVVHPPQDIRVGDKTMQVQLVTFTVFNIPSAAHPSGTTQREAMLAPYPYEPQPRNGPTANRPEYPGASLYYGQKGDTLNSLAARFYHKATLQGAKAIIESNPTLRGAKNASELKIVVDRPYWIPWNPADGRTMSDFLHAANNMILRERGPAAIPISFRYTWWESPKYVYQIWMIGSLLIVGVAWPALLGLMVQGGFGSMTAEEYDLSRFKGGAEPSAVPAAAKVTQDDMQRLRDLEENLEASLRASKSTGGPAAQPQQPAAPAVKTLSGAAEPAAKPPMTPEEKKSYEGGEFYPVARPGKDKKDKP
jgi:hypothetical protein